VGIARRARKLISQPALPEIARIKPLFDMATTMFKDAVKAYADSDIELARTLKLRDKGLDEQNRALAETLADLMQKNPDSIRGYLELIFIARCLERIGDQAKSIAEDTIYAVEVKDIRHTDSPS
jgi:phosphate transport system protein